MNENARAAVKAGDQTVRQGSEPGGESKTLVAGSGLEAGAQTAQWPGYPDPGDRESVACALFVAFAEAKGSVERRTRWWFDVMVTDAERAGWRAVADRARQIFWPEEKAEPRAVSAPETKPDEATRG